MKICSLCKHNPADKTGSHIVPHFLLKRIENVDSRKGRGYELGFVFDKHGSVPYFGRELLPERLEEVFGEISEKDVSSNKHPLVADNLLCSECEKSLATIESEYASTISKVSHSEYASGTSSFIGLLFWGSILWRLSVHGKSGANLDTDKEEVLRQFLCSHLSPRKKISEYHNSTASDHSTNLSYRLLRCSQCLNIGSQWLILHPHFYDNPCLIVDEFLLVFSFDGLFKEHELTDCFGLNDLILQAPINKDGNSEIIKPFTRESYIALSDGIVNLLKGEYLTFLNACLDNLHVSLGGPGSSMPSAIKKEILGKISSDEIRFGRRYTHEELFRTISEVIKVHMKQ
jgi:hypothetical protein